MKNKMNLVEFLMTSIIVLTLLLTLLPDMISYAATADGNVIPFGTGGVATLDEIEEDEILTDDEALLEEESRLDEEASKNEDPILEDDVQSEIVTYASNGALLKYHFIDTTGSGGGDATLIEVKDRFYLVDAGPARGTTRLNKYLNKHVPRKNSKIEIQVAIITHNHTDHYRGIEYILNDTDNYRVKKILKSSISPKDDINAACRKSQSKNGTTVQTLKVGEIVPLAKYNNAQITVYGPSDSFENVSGQDGTRTNNLSMIVKVDAVKKLIIMGDLYYAGFNRARSKYGAGLFSGNYSFCKVGHHGIRNGGDDGNQNVDKLNEEIALYKAHINAEYYIFTASNETKNNLTYKNNYNRFRKGFGVLNVDETSDSGNICIEIEWENNWGIDRERY